MPAAPFQIGQLVELAQLLANVQTQMLYPAGMLARVKTLLPGGQFIEVDILDPDNGNAVLVTAIAPITTFKALPPEAAETPAT